MFKKLGHVAHMVTKTKVCRILVRKDGEIDHLEDVALVKYCDALRIR